MSLEKLNFLYEPLQSAYPTAKQRKAGAVVTPLTSDQLIDGAIESVQANQLRKFQENVVVLLEDIMSRLEELETRAPEPAPKKATAAKTAAASESAE